TGVRAAGRKRGGGHRRGAAVESGRERDSTPTTTRPPVTRAEDIVDVLHGVAVHDPYRWLEDGESEEVRLWTEEQGRHARAVLDASPLRARVRERLRQLFAIGLVTPPLPRGGRYFHQRRALQQEQPVLYVREGVQG